VKNIPDLWIGFRDAENYKRRENKELFDHIFIRTSSLEKLITPSSFFLIGEKGTGKTAYAVYLANTSYRDNVSTIRYIRETEYQKFVSLKKSKNLDLSDFTNIWKVIIYLLLAQQIRDKEKHTGLLRSFRKFSHLERAIDDYYQNAFAPEILYAIQFAEEAKVAAELISKYAKVSGDEKSSISFSENRFQTNLLYIQRQFEDALRSLKLNRNHVLFIDGIDIRPQSIPYPIYSECVKGLANAIWSVNNDFFANIKDSKGRIKVVLLLRPDIFNSLGLQNQNSKIRDNSVILDWITTYSEYRRSSLFLLADRILSYQQKEKLTIGKAWDYYFPYKDKSSIRGQHRENSSFNVFLRYSLYRPRDILTILSIQKENFVEERRDPNSRFSYNDFTIPAFTRKYSDYMLGEVKDALGFYYDPRDYELFIKFFQFLNGRSRFTYQEFCKSYDHYRSFLDRNSIEHPAFCEAPDQFLQFIYDLNVICYIADAKEERFFGWCYRMRSPSNIAPKVRTHVRYEIHYGLMKALDLGKTFNTEDY
jgi:hypothetical protein